jgi:uncharacterized protein YceH (UPF0502 family)
MITLTRDESRVLGVLIEKAQTTPAQYPLTLNALVVGSNQKNNRDPVTNFDEERVFDAVDSLRTKGLVRELMLSGSRVPKYRHVAREVLSVTTEELVILAELLLRGPQTVGELRGRASRMHPLESLESTQAVLNGLIARAEPMLRDFPPSPGSRAKRYVQLLCPELHPLDHVSQGTDSADDFSALPARAGDQAPKGLVERVDQLESEVRQLRQSVLKLALSLGEQDVASQI